MAYIVKPKEFEAIQNPRGANSYPGWFDRQLDIGALREGEDGMYLVVDYTNPEQSFEKRIPDTAWIVQHSPSIVTFYSDDKFNEIYQLA